MSLFDFLKRKKNPMAALMRDPDQKPMFIAVMLEGVVAQKKNLEAVGRGDEGKRVAREFLDKVLQEYLTDEYFEHPAILSALTNAAMQLGEAEHGMTCLQAVVENVSVIDLTTVYANMATLAHAIGMPKQDKLNFLELAIAAETPPRCKKPASKKDKAKAHFMAQSAASVLHQDDIAKRHLDAAKALAPEVNFDDTEAKWAWLTSK